MKENRMIVTYNGQSRQVKRKATLLQPLTEIHSP